MIAGADDPAPQLLRKALRPGHGDAGLYFSGETVPAPEAAWINGTAGRALDYDDVALRGHPSTMLVPAILAEGEALRASGRDMLAAYVAGYETCAELAWRDPGHHHRKGWNPTGIFGPIGAAAACASLRHLDAEHASNALARAAPQSSGVMANFGTMTTPFRAGRSAHSGLITARLAEVGFTASPDAIEHSQGFLTAVSPAGEADRETPAQALGSEWKILKYRLGIKNAPLVAAHTGRSMHDRAPRAPSARTAGNPAAQGFAERHALPDPARSSAADRAGGQVQHGVRYGGGGDRRAPGLPNIPTALFGARMSRI
jgi:2-methylcitrate dehydratase PrpD